MLAPALSFDRSEKLFARAQEIVAGGTTQGKAPNTLLPGEYPIYVARGQGATLWDVDGNRFLDWILAYGIIVLGYCDPDVDAAAIREIREGFAFPLTRPVQNELAELLVKVIPCAEMVHFFLKRHRDQVACVIMMPLEIEPPEPGFLAGVKDLAHQHGALFILDEMRSGFHLALGGAQEYYGVTPDLATFSKAICNGYAISVLAGRRELMQDWFVCAAHTEQDLAGTLETSEAAFRAVKQELARGYRAPTRQEMAVTVSTGLDAANKTRICR